jgi:hypothetical protein
LTSTAVLLESSQTQLSTSRYPTPTHSQVDTTAVDMSQIFARAASALRCTASRRVLLSRPSPLPIYQTASLSFQPTRRALNALPSQPVGAKTEVPSQPVETKTDASSEPVEQKAELFQTNRPPPKTPEELARLPYFVARTPSGLFPLYRKLKNSNRHLLCLKKVQGDKQKLVAELEKLLGVSDGSININPRTGHLMLRVTIISARSPRVWMKTNK